VGRKVAKASDIGGGNDRGSEKKVMCQNPIHTSEPKSQEGEGLRNKNMMHVTTMLNASASSRRSVHCDRVSVFDNSNEIGNTEGKGVEVNPFIVEDIKFV
jgi:hypothetical protein